MADLNMADGLARLLRLAPGITLDNRAIKLLSEGKINQVMAEFNGTWEQQFKEEKSVETIKGDDATKKKITFDKAANEVKEFEAENSSDSSDDEVPDLIDVSAKSNISKVFTRPEPRSHFSFVSSRQYKPAKFVG